MARIRTIKPEFWTDSFMVQLEPIGRLIFIALWSAADDHGFIVDEPSRIAMEIMPREDPLAVDDWIQFFVATDRLELYCHEDGYTFFRIKNWTKHQRVDRPSKSRISREGSRKLAIRQEVRREVAERYGCEPGETCEASCFYCGAPGRIHWYRLHNGKPSGWVTFPGLELDHVEAEFNGGSGNADNFTLACQHCNRSKGTNHWYDALCKANGATPSRYFARTREASRTEVDQGSGSGIRDLPPGGRAGAREAMPFEVIPPEPDEEEPVPVVPGDRGAMAVVPRVMVEGVPFAELDWEGRASGSMVLREWIRIQPTPPSADDRNRFGRAAKRIADQHGVGEIAMAFVGMRYLWPYAEPPIGKGQPWTPEDLLRDFAKAVPAAAKHPQFKAQKRAEEFNQALDRAASGGGFW